MQIYEFHISKIIIHHLDGLFGPNILTSSQLALLVQLVERCTGIAEVMGSNPIWANILSDRTLESLRWFFLLFSPFSFHLALGHESMFFIPFAASQLPHALPNETAKYALQLLRPRL